MNKKKNKLLLTGKIIEEKLSFLINKIVDFTFFGEKFKFYLSHALFSSFDIDEGTKLLLKTIAQKINVTAFTTLRDIGSGAGIIGICLKKKFPHLNVVFSDRDMLALDFTKINCIFNNIKEYYLLGELGIELMTSKYDFIVSNIPAKIGSKGLEELVKKMLVSLNHNGFCAIVVIKSLEEKTKKILTEINALIKYEEKGNAHWVCHFTSSESHRIVEYNNDVLEPYIRDIIMQKNFGVSYKLKTVYNIPDFDTIGYQSELLLKLLENSKLSGACLFWNPLQGHIPVIAHKLFPGKISKYILAGRDLLQIKIAQDNLEFNGVSKENIFINHVSLISEVIDSVQYHIIIPDVIPMTNNYDIILKDLSATNIFISDKSTNIYRLLENQKSYQVKNKIKKNGFTGVYLTYRIQ